MTINRIHILYNNNNYEGMYLRGERPVHIYLQNINRK